MTTTKNAKTLAALLYHDDLSRADEVPVTKDGAAAYHGWVTAAAAAGDHDTLADLRAVDRDAFAREWERLASR